LPGPGDAEVLALVENDAGLLLGNGHGLFRIREDGPPVPLDEGIIAACTALARDAAGRIWVATPYAVYRREGEQFLGPFGPGADTRSGRVIGLAIDDAQVWVLMTTGLARLVDGRWLPVPSPDGDDLVLAVRAIATAAGSSYLWAGTDQLLAGVRVSGPGETSWDLNQLPRAAEDRLCNFTRCVAPRAEGGIWVGTVAGLLGFDAADAWSLDLEGLDVRALCAASDGTLWMIAWKDGVLHGPATGRPEFQRAKLEGLPVALAQGQDGHPYGVTERGLWELSLDRPRAVERDVPPLARCLAWGPDQVWWLGTARGAYMLATGEGWKLAGEQPGPVQTAIHALTVIGETLWVATGAGLWARRGNAWVPHAAAVDGRPVSVGAVAPAGGTGKIWLARADGIVRYNPATDRVDARLTTARSGLPSRRVSALIEAGGSLWIATQAGISQLRLDAVEPNRTTASDQARAGVSPGGRDDER
jgi:ligand-binding sensor domain-containing protein